MTTTPVRNAQNPNVYYPYHMVPPDMVGDILRPLNVLKETHPDLQPTKAAKYAGREWVMDQRIPTLDCKWNDVLQFSPIEPAEFKRALVDAGMPPRTIRFYQIDPQSLDRRVTTIYRYALKAKKGNLRASVLHK